MQKMLQLLGDRRAMLQEEGKSQRGFTLVELLVVVIIIGILAGIAIPVFLNQREGAWRSELESDVKNLALAIESFSMENNGSYRTVPTGALGATEFGTLEFTPSNAGSTFTLAVTADDYTITATHPDLTGDSLSYDSDNGGIQGWTP